MNESGITSAATAAIVTSSDAVVTAAEEDESQETPFQPAQPARPTVWFITACNSPIGIAVARRLIERGDHVVAAVLPSELDREGRSEEFKSFVEEVNERSDEDELCGAEFQQLKVVCVDVRSISECQSAVAEALQHFQYIDVLFCCNSEALFGTVEELNQTTCTQSLVLDQFHANFFGPVNVIQAVLPTMRAQRCGHIVLLTGITGHLGTPGLSMYCASQWAIEGYCDTLAYEIAPFNVKVSIVQSNIEISVLTNKMVSAPAMPAYMPPINPAPLPRRTFNGLLDRLKASSTASTNDEAVDSSPEPPASQQQSRPSAASTLAEDRIDSLFPTLPAQFQANLVAETVHAVLVIGGHANPPSRHIVGAEAVTSVREKLKTVSEELEEFVECSTVVDL